MAQLTRLSSPDHSIPSVYTWEWGRNWATVPADIKMLRGKDLTGSHQHVACTCYNLFTMGCDNLHPGNGYRVVCNVIGDNPCS